MIEGEFDKIIKNRHQDFVLDLDACLVATSLREAIPAARSEERDVVLQEVSTPNSGDVIRLLLAEHCKGLAAVGALVFAAVLVFACLIGPDAMSNSVNQATRCAEVECGTLHGTRQAGSMNSSTAGRRTSAGIEAPGGVSQGAITTGRLQAITSTAYTVNFAPNSAELAPLSDIALWDVVAEARPGSRISIVGHSARVGSREGAYRLSLRRAESVRDRLESFGGRVWEMDVRGVGYDEAVDPDEDANPQDRRVVLTFDSRGRP